MDPAPPVRSAETLPVTSHHDVRTGCRLHFWGEEMFPKVLLLLRREPAEKPGVREQARMAPCTPRVAVLSPAGPRAGERWNLR